jgi:prevent-host-death family protein
MKNWKLVEFNQELGEIAAHAHGCGPQCVTVNGKVDIVVLSPDEYARLRGEPLAEPPADLQSEPETGLSMFTALRRRLEEQAGGEDVYWPWDWDWEKREWVVPADHALSS